MSKLEDYRSSKFYQLVQKVADLSIRLVNAIVGVFKTK